jgi:hypothetical protein
MLRYCLMVLCLIVTQIIHACSCNSNEDFLTVAPNTPLVSLVKVTKYLSFKNIYDKDIPMSMEVEIIRTFKGEEKRKSIIVWGDNGILCRPYLSQFVLGKFYVIAFETGSNGSNGRGHKDEKENDYAISICGTYWLNANEVEKSATGSISNTLKTISFENLWEFFNGDKTKELTPKDFKDIYQLALDLPELQKYYHVGKDSAKKEIVIQYFEKGNHNKLDAVKKFGNQIKVLTASEIKKEKVESYFVLEQWTCSLNSISMELSFAKERIFINYRFYKFYGKWLLVSHDIEVN